MKKFMYLMAAAATLTACHSGNSGYTIQGTVEGATDGEYVYLQKVQDRNLIKLDSAVIENGAFTLKGQQDTAAFRYLTYQKQDTQGLHVEFFLENGQINVALSPQSSATGTPNNDVYQSIKNKNDELTPQMQTIYQSLSDSTLSEEQKKANIAKMEAMQEEFMQFMKDNIKQHIGEAVGVELLKQNFHYMGVDELDPLMGQIPATYDNDPIVKRIKDQVRKMKATAVGQKFTDFTMKDTKGKDVKLSDFVGKGKVVLVDFWASWCGPCRREMPNLVEAYKKYKNKNFEIVGVSLDRNEADWKRAIKDLKITWPQMSDLKFWNCEGAKLYAVSSIPHVILIDGDGIILARGLHGEELQQKLAEVLK